MYSTHIWNGHKIFQTFRLQLFEKNPFPELTDFKRPISNCSPVRVCPLCLSLSLSSINRCKDEKRNRWIKAEILPFVSLQYIWPCYSDALHIVGFVTWLQFLLWSQCNPHFLSLLLPSHPHVTFNIDMAFPVSLLGPIFPVILKEFYSLSTISFSFILALQKAESMKKEKIHELAMLAENSLGKLAGRIFDVVILFPPLSSPMTEL